MKIGIFLGYGPNLILGKEGLGRYLGNLIKNLQIAENQITIACPKWTLDTLEDLCKDFFIDTSMLDFIVVDRMPVLWKIYGWWTRKRRRGHKSTLRKSLKWSVNMLIEYAISITSFFVFFIMSLFLLCAVIILLPLIIGGSLIYLLFTLTHNIYIKCDHWGKDACRKLIRGYENICIGGMQAYVLIYNKILKNVHEQLVKKINDVKGIDIWYSPAVFWPAFNKIKSNKVINAPDLIPENFATQWGDNKATLFNSKLSEKTIDEGNYFITYSDYVKQTLLIGRFGKKEENVLSIPHGINELSVYITMKCGSVSKEEMESYVYRYCKKILQTLASHTKEIDAYMKNYCFENVKYIFYPSQLRPHKNILNLIKAYEYMLRKKYVRIKLVFTCNLDDNADIKDYVFNHRLQYDVLFFNNVSVQQLAALYKCAELVVNPTLYEGGFPFTFGEGMSVGTPSVMSRIPQVMEMVKDYGWDNYLFDPYDYKDIADKVMYGLKHRKELIAGQMPLFYDMKRRTWEVIGNEYVEAFQYFVEQEKEKEAC